jgi:hypothetical protein
VTRAQPIAAARPQPVEATPEIAAASIPPRASTQPAGAPDDGGLAADLAVLDAADAALQGGRAREALAALERHARDVPASPLAPERAILRVRALCELGRTADAEQLAATWRARADLPRVADALERTCAG